MVKRTLSYKELDKLHGLCRVWFKHKAKRVLGRIPNDHRPSSKNYYNRDRELSRFMKMRMPTIFFKHDSIYKSTGKWA